MANDPKRSGSCNVGHREGGGPVIVANEPEQTPLLDAVLICLHRSTRSQDGRRVCCQCGVDRGPRDPDEWGAGEVEEAEPLTDVQWHEKECA
jgi:hypothetical protein